MEIKTAYRYLNFTLCRRREKTSSAGGGSHQPRCTLHAPPLHVAGGAKTPLTILVVELYGWENHTALQCKFKKKYLVNKITQFIIFEFKIVCSS